MAKSIEQTFDSARWPGVDGTGPLESFVGETIVDIRWLRN